MAELVFICICIVAAFVLAIYRAPLWAWATTAALAALTWQFGIFDGGPASALPDLLSGIAWLVAAILGALSVPAWRRQWLVAPVFGTIKQVLPRVSDTEQQALDAGTIGFDAELFSGTPDWDKLRAVPPIRLTDEEQSVPRRPDRRAVPDDRRLGGAPRPARDPGAVWDFVKKHGFLGMLISKEHGGLGFSAQAQSLVLGKIASRSPDVVHHRHGAELAGPRRADREIRHAGAEATLSAAPRQGPGGSVLRADGPDLGLRRRRHARRGHRRQRPARRAGGAGHPPVLGQALHHTGPNATLSASPSTCSIPTTCSARARTSASRWH